MRLLREALGSEQYAGDSILQGQVRRSSCLQLGLAGTILDLAAPFDNKHLGRLAHILLARTSVSHSFDGDDLDRLGLAVEIDQIPGLAAHQRLAERG